MMDAHRPQAAQIQGYGHTYQKATWLVRALAGAIDTLWIVAVFWVFVRYVFGSPVLSGSAIFAVVTTIVFLWIAQKHFLRATIGQWIWQIRLTTRQDSDESWWQRIFLNQLEQRSGLPQMIRSLAIACTLCSLGLVIVISKATVTDHPILKRADLVLMDPFIPPKEEVSRWHTLPFYYASGAWPKYFQWRPILFTIPYKKGPPKRFAGKVISRWHMPDVRLVIGGPKTPVVGLARNDLRDCLLKRGNLSRLKCLQIRNQVLSPYIQSFFQKGLPDIHISWFEVENHNIPITEQARGIHIIARDEKRTTEQYILVNGLSSHQPIALQMRSNKMGEEASALLRKTIRSLRVFYDLRPGRALVDEQISATQMRELEGIQNPLNYVERLSEIQAFLISKISVEPKSHHAYFHLGGTALMMAKHAGTERIRGSKNHSGEILALLDELTVIARPLVRTSYLYARDVKPHHPRTTELEQMWIEAKKY